MDSSINLWPNFAGRREEGGREGRERGGITIATLQSPRSPSVRAIMLEILSAGVSGEFSPREFVVENVEPLRVYSLLIASNFPESKKRLRETDSAHTGV